MSTKAYDQQKCLKIFMKFLLQFVLVKWGDRESWNIYDFNHGKPHLNTSTCPIQNMNNIFHHTLCGTQTFVQKTCFVSDPCRSCLWWHIDLSWSFQVGSNEQFSSFERKSFNEHIYNIILASFLDDFNFLKACSSPKTMSCGVQGGPWTRWTWNFWPAEVEKKGKVLDLSFQETSEKHIWIHPREYQNCELSEATKPLKRWNLGTSGLPFANIQEAGKFYGCPTRNIWIRCF